MHGIHFSKGYAETILKAVNAGEPLPPHEGGWTGNNLLTLAGILSAAVWSQGPHNRQALGLTAAQMAGLHPEQREAVEETLGEDIKDAIEFLSLLTFRVIGGDYDAAFEPEVKAVIYRQADGTPTVRPAQGFKPT